MTTYRKKPETVTAVQWLGDAAEIADFAGGVLTVHGEGLDRSLLVTMYGSETEIPWGDFLIKNEKGEYCLSMPEVFLTGYEETKDVT